MKQFTITRTVWESSRSIMEADITEAYAEDLTKLLNKNYALDNPITITVDMIKDCLEGEGNCRSIVIKDNHNPNYKYCLSDFIIDCVNDYIWSGDAELIDSDIEEWSDHISVPCEDYEDEDWYDEEYED